MPALVPVTVIAVLLLVATLIHLDKFDLDSLFGWFWLIVYCACRRAARRARCWRQLAVPPRPGAAGRHADTRRRCAAALALQALVMGGVGIALVCVAVHRRRRCGRGR